MMIVLKVPVYGLYKTGKVKIPRNPLPGNPFILRHCTPTAPGPTPAPQPRLLGLALRALKATIEA